MSSSDPQRPQLWVIVPAAGSGRRMGAGGVPKQYLPLAGRTVLEWSLRAFLGRGDCRAIVVVLAADDERWSGLSVAQDPRVLVARGGEERADSVRAGLEALATRAADEDWVLVHDAARPCLRDEELARLIEVLSDDPVGGLLAVPVVDTLKRGDDADRVRETVPRTSLWRAATPQMFRCGLLRRALAAAAAGRMSVTDESQAIEALGLQPRLVAGDADNIKITVVDDRARAERILQSRRGT
jgi:2-C-methyl-D-erythritol 4-phosphate cytidylyltransferase